MDALLLSRLQFAITTVYHFFFVPLTLGLSLFIAVLETIYVVSGKDVYKRMVRFWGKLFVINFAMGVVTGIVQEFQFGMNWSEYSRFVGDIFGVPLAIEALLAFFLESVFLGVWLFGWEKLSPRLHAAAFWMVAIGSNLSALWILIANSFMQQPVGYAVNNGRAEMTDFFALVFNPHVGIQWAHVFGGGLATAAFFVLGISAWHLLKKKSDAHEGFRISFQFAAVLAVAASLYTGLVGHSQGQHIVQVQPMKMAAAEALWESESPASFSLLTIGNEAQQRDVFAIRIPALLSFMSYNNFSGEVKGIKNLQAEYVGIYGPGNYVPPVAMSYWSFRFMVGVGSLMFLVALFALYLVWKGQHIQSPARLKWLPYAIVLPYIGNTTGWLLAEIGRQPWIVFGLMRTEDAVSPNNTLTDLWITLVGFTLIYGLLMAADLFLLNKFARKGMGGKDAPEAGDSPEDQMPSLSGASA